MVGLVTGKALAHAAGKPLIAVNHLEGHALSPRLADPALEFPYLLLLVSGGHCQLLLVEGEGLQLTIDGKVSPCRPGVVVAFRGEAHTSATLARGPVVDLGLMFHRKKAKGNLWFEAQPGAVLDADVVVGIGGDAQIEVDGELVVIEHKDAAVQLAGKVVVLRRGVVAAIAVAVLPTSPTAAP
jgi:hypothetical protein